MENESWIENDFLKVKVIFKIKNDTLKLKNEFLRLKMSF